MDVKSQNWHLRHEFSFRKYVHVSSLEDVVKLNSSIHCGFWAVFGTGSSLSSPTGHKHSHLCVFLHTLTASDLGQHPKSNDGEGKSTELLSILVSQTVAYSLENQVLACYSTLCMEAQMKINLLRSWVTTLQTPVPCVLPHSGTTEFRKCPNSPLASPIILKLPAPDHP